MNKPLPIGLGIYAASRFGFFQPALPLGGGTCVLVAGVDGRELHDIALACRYHHLDVTRRRVVNDSQQIDFTTTAESNVDMWYGRILGGLNPEQFLVRYHRAVGFNEMYTPDTSRWDFLIATERSLCKKLHAVGIPYAFGSFAVGNVEPDQFVRYFRDLCHEADAISAHLYLAPHGKTLESEANRWYARRPYAWWQACVQAGIAMPSLLGTESGTFLDWKTTGLTSAQYVGILGQISTMLAKWRHDGMAVLGHCLFATGCEGMNAIWNIDADAVQLIGAWNNGTNIDRSIPWSPKRMLPGDFTSPNHASLRTTVLGCVIHSTRGNAASLQSEYEATVRHFHDPAPGGNPDSAVSADGVAGPNNQTHFPCPPDVVTWHARSYNQKYRGIELVQPRYGEPIADDVMDTAARMVATWWLHDKANGHEWPLQWDTVHGLAEHWEIPPGIQDGKTDIQAPFDRTKFLALVRQYAGVDALTDAQKKAVLDDLDVLWGYTKADTLILNPAESEQACHERIVALKTTLGLNT